MPKAQKPELRLLAKALKEARGSRSQEDLAYEVRAKTSRKITAGAISQIETGRIRPEMETMEAIAEVLGIPPTDFAEYRLANARAMLDEREVGLDVALDVLMRLETALASAPRARRAIAAAQRARSQTPTPAVHPAPKQKPRAGGGRKRA